MNVSVRNRIQASRDTLITLFAGALSVMFTQQLVSYLNDKLREFNIWGIDSQIFALLATGIILVVLVWFGIIKQPQK